MFVSSKFGWSQTLISTVVRWMHRLLCCYLHPSDAFITVTTGDYRLSRVTGKSQVGGRGSTPSHRPREKHSFFSCRGTLQMTVFCLTALFYHPLHLPSPSLTPNFFFKINIPSFHYTHFNYTDQTHRKDWKRSLRLWTPVPYCHIHHFINVSCSTLKRVCFFLRCIWIGKLL